MSKLSFVTAVLALGYCLSATSVTLHGQTAASPTFDSHEFAEKIAAQEKSLLDGGKLHPLGTLFGALKAQPEKNALSLPTPSKTKLDPADVHDKLFASTLMVGLYYRCKDCHQMHASTGGGFVVAEGGVATTCAHILTLDPKKMLQAYPVAIDARGQVYPIDRIIACDEAADTTLFHAQGLDAPALPLRADARVGEPVYCLSHPGENPFIFTAGLVSRADTGQVNGRTLRSLAVSCEYSPGSSGCPITDASGNVLAQVCKIFPQLLESDVEQSNSNHRAGATYATVYNLRSATGVTEIARLADPATRPVYTAQPPVAADDAAAAPVAAASPSAPPDHSSDMFNVHCRYHLFTAPTDVSLDGITSFEKLKEKIGQSGGKITTWNNEGSVESSSANYEPIGFNGATGYYQIPGSVGPLSIDNTITRGVDFRLTFHDRTSSGVGLLVKVNDNRETPAAADNVFDVNATLAKGAFTFVKLGPPQKDSQAWLAVQADNFDGVVLTAPVQSQAGGKLPADKKVDFKFIAANGQEVDTTRMRGKVILVDFWATWCGPCIEALPKLQAFYDKFHQDGLEILGINLDDERSAMDQFVRKHPHPWPQSVSAPLSKNPLADRFDIHGIPFFLLIDKTGVAEIIEARLPTTDDLIATRLKQ